MRLNSGVLLAILATCICLFTITTSRLPKFPTTTMNEIVEESDTQLKYQKLYFDQKVSHFSFKHTGKLFKQKYLMDTSNWNKDARGPILMYCGNEGPI